eukprot:c12491_g1_i1.p1 GENE.c12491_g1_i1~~c12491_g1_i1.p1  ORF type:complete len:217 (+),score=61.77 c12491_g1_i1:2-652(+)
MQWPDHCVQGTFGARFSPYLQIPINTTVVKKGFTNNLDSYSGFGGRLTQSSYPFWNDTENHSTLQSQPNLAAILALNQISRLFILGIAIDYCVKMSSLDAIYESIPQVFMISSASKGVTNQTISDAEALLVEKGVFVTSPERISVDSVFQEICSPSPSPSVSFVFKNDSHDHDYEVLIQNIFIGLFVIFFTVSVGLTIYLVRIRQKKSQFKDHLMA